jgi:hypothetical protein
MVGPAEAWVVGDKGTAAHIVGSSVTLVPLSLPDHFFGVWGSGPQDIWAVGGNGAIERYDGTVWATVESGTALHLRSVWGTGVSDVWAVGDNGTILHYNGTVWLPASATRGNNTLNAAWGPPRTAQSAGSVFAVGDRGLGLAWSSADWIETPFHNATTRNYYGIWGMSAQDVWVVGEAGEIVHAVGTLVMRVSSGTTVDLYAVWGSAGNNILAVGQGGRLARYDGMNWTSMNLPAAGGAALRGIFGLSPTAVFMVGDGGTILKANDDRRVEDCAAPFPGAVCCVWGNDRSDEHEFRRT